MDLIAHYQLAIYTINIMKINDVISLHCLSTMVSLRVLPCYYIALSLGLGSLIFLTHVRCFYTQH